MTEKRRGIDWQHFPLFSSAVSFYSFDSNSCLFPWLFPLFLSFSLSFVIIIPFLTSSLNSFSSLAFHSVAGWLDFVVADATSFLLFSFLPHRVLSFSRFPFSSLIRLSIQFHHHWRWFPLTRAKEKKGKRGKKDTIDLLPSHESSLSFFPSFSLSVRFFACLCPSPSFIHYWLLSLTHLTVVPLLFRLSFCPVFRPILSKKYS